MIDLIINNDFSNVYNAEFAVVDFSASWCGPCKMLAPIMEEIAVECDDIKFYNVDVDNNEDLAQKYNITNIPAIAIFKNGKLIETRVGFQPKNSILNFIKTKK